MAAAKKTAAKSGTLPRGKYIYLVFRQNDRTGDFVMLGQVRANTQPGAIKQAVQEHLFSLGKTDKTKKRYLIIPQETIYKFKEFI